MRRSGGMIVLLAAAGTACHPAPQPGASAIQADTAAAIAAEAESAAAETTGAGTTTAAETAAAPTATPAGPAAAPVSQPGDTTVEGTVRSVGSVPMVRTVVETSGGGYQIMGPLASEIGGLAGAKVRVTGHLRPAAPPPPRMAIEAHGYTLVEVGGEVPHVGTLLSRDGVWWLAGADTVKLGGVPSDFPAKAGDRIYVVGDLTKGVLAVRSYGIIARAGP